MNILFLFLINISFATEDSLKVDSLKYKNLGSINFLEKIEIDNNLKSRSSLIEELIEENTSAFILDYGSPGLRNKLYFFDQPFEIFFEGRSLGDAQLINFNPTHFPKEWLNNIEIKSDINSGFNFNNQSIGLINLTTKDFSSTKPLTKLFFVQGPYDFGIFDASYSQNIFQNTNFSFGLTRNFFGSNHESDGFKGRYLNENFDLWIYRAKIRSQINENTTFQFSYFGLNDSKGINSGIDTAKTFGNDIFDDLIAEVISLTQLQKNKQKHLDLILNIENLILKNGETKLHFYHSNFLIDNINRENTTSPKDYWREFNGAIFSQSYFVKFAKITFQTEFIKRNISENNFLNFESKIIHSSLYGNLYFLDFLNSDFFYRKSDDKNNYGFKINLLPFSFLKLFAGYSEIENEILVFDYLYFAQPVTNIQSKNNEFGFRVSTNNLYLNFSQILIQRKDIYSNTHAKRLQFESGFENEVFNIKLFYTNLDNVELLSSIPKEFIKINSGFKFIIGKGKYESEIGLNYKYFNLEKENNNSILNIYTSINIDDATLHLKVENVLDVKTMIIRNYPIMPRGIKFGVSWNFIN